MTRRCSHCSNNGHNSRTCPSRGGAAPAGGSSAGAGVKLFGVRLTDGSFMKKSASMGNLMHYQSNAGSPSSDPPQDPPAPEGYLSDDPNHASCSSNRRIERKKGTPWTAEEHRLFLLGLQRLGKGDWRGISRNFVVSRTPTQVASHAQKYFIRQTNASRRKRRSSLFDMAPDMVELQKLGISQGLLSTSLELGVSSATTSLSLEIGDTDSQPLSEEHMLPPQPPQAAEPTTMTHASSFPSLDLSLITEAAEPEPMEATSSEPAEEDPSFESDLATLPEDSQNPILPTIFPAFIPIPFPYWPQNPGPEEPTGSSNHQVLKPTPVVPTQPVDVDQLVGMSRLKLSEGETPLQLSLNPLDGSTRQSAFHPGTAAPFNGPDLSEGKSSVIKAV